MRASLLTHSPSSHRSLPDSGKHKYLGFSPLISNAGVESTQLIILFKLPMRNILRSTVTRLSTLQQSLKHRQALQRSFAMAAPKSNNAAWITAPKAHPLEVRPSPLGVPAEGQILLRNRALAINPIDGKLQYFSVYPLEYPEILGEDVAGEVAAVGPGVTQFKVGDRVLGNPGGFVTKRKEDQGFQEYTILDVTTSAPIPDSVSFERAATIPLCLSTASAGLFNPDFLNLQRPTHPAREFTGQTVLVWGGSSCVGTNAIQLLKAAGYDVVTTASPKNFDLVKGIGASHVSDYRSSTVVADLLEATKGKTIAGVYDAVGIDGAFQACVEFAQGSHGNKFVASVFNFIKDVPEGVEAKKVFAPSIRGNGVAEDIWVKFLPKALAAGAYVVATEPVIAGTGLDKIQDAIDLERKGLSAQKAVVLLD